MIDYHCCDTCRHTDTERQKAFEAAWIGDMLRCSDSAFARNGFAFSETLDNALYVYCYNSVNVVGESLILVPLKWPFNCLSDATNNSQSYLATHS